MSQQPYAPQPQPYQQAGYGPPPVPQPPRRRGGARSLLWILPAVGLALVVVVGVALYATGVIGSSGGGADAEPWTGKYKADEALCGKLDTSRFERYGEASKPFALSVMGSEARSMDCYGEYGDTGTFETGTLFVTFAYFASDAKASADFTTDRLKGGTADKAAESAGPWAKGYAGQVLAGGTDYRTHLVFLEGNAIVGVSWEWNDPKADAADLEASVWETAVDVHGLLTGGGA